MKTARVLSLFPRTGFQQRLYLVGLAGGRVKVGISGNVHRRFLTHARTHGPAFIWCHVFAGYREAQAVALEQEAIASLARIGAQIGSTEVFDGIGRQEAIACVRECIKRTGVARPDGDAHEVARIQHVTFLAGIEAHNFGHPCSILRSGYFRPELVNADFPAPQAKAA